MAYIPNEGSPTMQYLKASKLVGASISVVALTSIGLPSVAQITVTMAGVSATVPEAGRTEQLNVSQGQRTTLSVGNGVTLGTSAQFTSSIGSVALSRSVLEPTRVALESSIGKGAVLGLTDINIENISANSDAGQIQSDGGSNLEVGADSKFASGKARIDGMISSSLVEVDTTLPEDAGRGIAEYYAIANPQVKEDMEPFHRDLLVDESGQPILDADGNLQYTGKILTYDPATNDVLNDPEGPEEGRGILKGGPGLDEDYWESVNGCTPTASNSCIYEKADVLKTGNSSANSSYQTSTNIDINSNAFTNVFGQAF